MKTRYIFLLILVITTLFYANSFYNSFQYDDQVYIEENINLRTAGLSDIFFHPSTLFTPGTATGHYRPLVLLTYVMNYRLNGLNPAGYHVVNLAFHISTAFLLYLIIRAMLGGGVALASALIFAVHPFNAEAVNYITARSSLMSGFFYLLAFYGWVKFRSQKLEVRSQKRYYFLLLTSYFYIVSFFAFLLGMLSKEAVVILPLILLIYDLYFIPVQEKTVYGWLKGRFKIALPIIPFVLIIIIPYFIIRLLNWGVILTPFKRTLLVQFYTELPVLVKYLKLFILPTGLNVDHYSEIYKTFFAWPVIASAGILILFIALAILSFRVKGREWRTVSFFMVWFFIVLSPTTIITLNAIFQENRGYLAVMVFAVSAGVMLSKLPALLPSSRSLTPLILAVLLLLYGIGTVNRNSIWKSEVTLWSDAVGKSPRFSRPYINLGTAYAKTGKYDLAIKNFLLALRFANPETSGDPVNIHYNLGTVYQQMGRLDLAVREYRTVTESRPSDFRPYYNLGVIYHQRGESEAAIEAYKNVLNRNPSDFRSYHNLGLIYQTRGQTRRQTPGDSSLAEGFYKKALMLNPDYAKSRYNLAVTYETGGKLELAREEYISTIKRNPDYLAAYYSLGYLYEKEGNLDMAIKIFRVAAKRNSGDNKLLAHIRSLEERQKRE